jgi:probable rRNA maturation factor
MFELLSDDLPEGIDDELPEWLESRIELLRQAASLPEQTEACVVLTDDRGIAELNLQYRGVEGPTDVLSFAMQEAEDADLTPDLLGDIVVSVETASRMVSSGEHRARVAAELGSSIAWGLREEVLFLVVHGLLHLLGYDHAEPDEEAEMREAEKRLFFAVCTLGAKATPA